MTREDAIDYVQAAFDAYESEFSIGDDWSKEHEARDMAIKALSREPKIEPCTTEYHRVYMIGWNEGRRKLVDAMEREIAI